MTILNLLKEDHAEVKDLLEQMCDTTERAAKKRQQLFEQMKTALMAHSHAEDATFYQPLLKDGDDPDALLEAEVEHQVVERLLMDIEQTEPTDEKWLAKVTVLKELIEHHVEEEESEIFKEARKTFDKKELDAMGERFEAAKEQEMGEAATGA
jgi:hemerythrin-like domain-containing protein